MRCCREFERKTQSPFEWLSANPDIYTISHKDEKVKWNLVEFCIKFVEESLKSR